MRSLRTTNKAAYQNLETVVFRCNTQYPKYYQGVLWDAVITDWDWDRHDMLFARRGNIGYFACYPYK